MSRRPRTSAEVADRAVLAPEDRERYERLRALASLLDSRLTIPGTRFGVGLDPILGLVPGLGDAATMAMSGWVVLQAARIGVPKSTLLLMLLNVGVDALVGTVPVLGDLFDFVWRSNRRNMRLLERHLHEPLASRAASRRWLWAIAAVIVVLVGLALWGAVELLRQIVARL
jgi:hypothetical protein